MFYLQITLLLLGITASVISPTRAKLTLNKQCGEVVCQEHTFCSPTDHSCRPCDVVCNKSDRNHDQNRCEEDCQDYLHDEMYAKKAVNSAVESVQNELFILKILVGLTLVISTIVLILLIVIMVKLSRRKRNKKPVPELPAVIYNNKYEKTSTPVRRSRSTDNNNDFRREPSESTLPEYSYDNPSMMPLPSPAHHV